MMLGKLKRVTLIVLIALSGMAQAQEAAPVEVNIDLSSHQATLRSFTESMEDYIRGDDNSLREATACLWLGELTDEERAAEAATLAEQLFDIIDSSQFRISDFELDDRIARATIREDPDVVIEILLNDDGRWRFRYTNTLENVGEWHDAIDWRAATPPEEGLHPLYWSPRATMRTFLFGMHRTAGVVHEEALGALDLSDIAESLRAERGEAHANVLKFILDRDAYVWLYEIPTYTEGPRYQHIEQPEGSVIIARIDPPPAAAPEESATADEEAEATDTPAPATQPAKWQFTAGTLRTLEALQSRYRTANVAEGVTSTVELPTRIRVRNAIADRAPYLLERGYLFEHWQWLGLALVVLLGWVISRLIGFIIRVIIDRWIGKRKNDEIERNERLFLRPIRIALMSWVWLIGLSVLDLPDNIYGVLVNIAQIITVVAGVWAGYRAIDIFGAYLLTRTRHTASAFDDLLVPIVTRTIKIVVIIAGGLILSDIFQLPVSKVVAGLGIGGLAVAFAAQQTISNFFGSITILLDQPFQIGDWVQIGDVDGSVESVGLRSTRVRTFYNSLVTVPNSTLMSENIDNYGRRRYRRIKTYVGVTYDTPPDKIEAFCEGIREIIRSHPYTVKNNFHVYFNQFNAASLDILVYCFVAVPDWATELRERERLFLDIMRLADDLDIEFAFPTQTIHLRKEEVEAKEHQPEPRPRAFMHGRKHAKDVVTRSFGDPSRKPPPVSYDDADGIERDILEAGFDEDDGDGTGH